MVYKREMDKCGGRGGGKHTAKAHAQISALPEKIGHGATARDVATEPTHVGDGLLSTDISQGSLVGILEGADLLDATELFLALGDLGQNDLAVVRARGGLFGGEVFEFRLEGVRLGHGVEEAGEEGSFLGRDLSGGSVVGYGAVADGPDVLGAIDDQVFVDFETATGFGLGGDLGHEVFDDGSEGVTGSPDQEAIGNLLDRFGSIWVVDLGFNVLVGDVLDHGLGSDFNVLFLEAGFRVLDQLLAEHGQNIGEGFDQSDMEIVFDLRNPLEQILLEEILELAGEFDAGGTTTDDDHV